MFFTKVYIIQICLTVMYLLSLYINDSESYVFNRSMSPSKYSRNNKGIRRRVHSDSIHNNKRYKYKSQTGHHHALARRQISPLCEGLDHNLFPATICTASGDFPYINQCRVFRHCVTVGAVAIRACCLNGMHFDHIVKKCLPVRDALCLKEDLENSVEYVYYEDIPPHPVDDVDSIAEVDDDDDDENDSDEPDDSFEVINPSVLQNEEWKYHPAPPNVFPGAFWSRNPYTGQMIPGQYGYAIPLWMSYNTEKIPVIKTLHRPSHHHRHHDGITTSNQTDSSSNGSSVDKPDNKAEGVFGEDSDESDSSRRSFRSSPMNISSGQQTFEIDSYEDKGTEWYPSFDETDKTSTSSPIPATPAKPREIPTTAPPISLFAPIVPGKFFPPPTFKVIPPLELVALSTEAIIIPPATTATPSNSSDVEDSDDDDASNFVNPESSLSFSTPLPSTLALTIQPTTTVVAQTDEPTTPLAGYSSEPPTDIIIELPSNPNSQMDEVDSMELSPNPSSSTTERDTTTTKSKGGSKWGLGDLAVQVQPVAIGNPRPTNEGEDRITRQVMDGESELVLLPLDGKDWSAEHNSMMVTSEVVHPRTSDNVTEYRVAPVMNQQVHHIIRRKRKIIPSQDYFYY